MYSMPFEKEIKFFLGSNTKRGFIPLFEELRNPSEGYRLFILKGGPGSGKSTLMRRIAKTLEEHGHKMEYIPCASDPDSLDAIIDYNAKSAVMDGTAPHTMDPKYPGAYDTIINLGDVWDNKALIKNKQRIIELTDIISQCHSMATSSISNAAALLYINRIAAIPFVNHDSIEATILQLIKELKDCETGTEHRRLLSAVSIGRIEFFEDTLTTLCPHLYVIPDDWGAASNELLSDLRNYALAKDLDFITCYCSIHTPDKIDHLLFPSIHLGITTSNASHSTSFSTGIVLDDVMYPIESSDNEIMLGRLSAAHQLIDTACKHVEDAKHLHDELEAFYIKAMDFTKVDGIYQRIVDEILEKE